MKAEFTYTNDHDEELTVKLPVRFAVCDNCEGHGSVMNESMRQHAYTPEEFNETFHDDEDREQYFKRGGIYDVQCPTCKGKRVVHVVDEQHLTADEREHWEFIKKNKRELEKLRQLEAFERAMGC